MVMDGSSGSRTAHQSSKVGSDTGRRRSGSISCIRCRQLQPRTDPRGTSTLVPVQREKEERQHSQRQRQHQQGLTHQLLPSPPPKQTVHTQSSPVTRIRTACEIHRLHVIQAFHPHKYHGHVGRRFAHAGCPRNQDAASTDSVITVPGTHTARSAPVLPVGFGMART